MNNNFNSYNALIHKLENLFGLIFQISNFIGGKSGVSFQQEQGSYILVKIGLTLESILKNLPHSKFYKSEIQFWDISTISILTRSLFESYLVYYYLCIDKTDYDTNELKELIWEYQANKERLKMLEIIKSKHPDIEGIKQEIEIFWKKIEANNTYNNLIESKKKTIRKGEIFKLDDNADIAVKSGISIEYFQASYKMLSAHIHTNGISIQHIKASSSDKEGELNYCKTIINYCIGCCLLSIRDSVKLFPDSIQYVPPDIFKYIIKWEKFFLKFEN